MRLYQLIDEDGAPVLVEHPECGTLILLPECHLVDLNWYPVPSSQIKFDSNWIESKTFVFELEDGRFNIRHLR